MLVLGIEGTAWCASAALFDAERDRIRLESDPYEPASGGIHPREAAEHMADAIPRVIDHMLEGAINEYGADAIDAVAFSRGPGLGPCLRTVGTAARALAGTLDVPLVGVNHMVAHLEIGRHESGFANPVCLNASGANAHLLGYHDGCYRVLGETMDAGVGNAIDKFTRHVGWTHPGGPKVEAAADRFATSHGFSVTDRDDAAVETEPQAGTDADLLELPYVVKGMDFSFSGISSAANDAADDGVPVDAICFALQEHVFAMLTEVSERALSLTGADELVLGGGVGQNARLRDMLATMCADRGAAFFAPDPMYLRDNAGMIAVLGAKMAQAGDTIPIRESTIDPNFRPDHVPVTWRPQASSVTRLPAISPTQSSVSREQATERTGTDLSSAAAGTERHLGAEAVVDVSPTRVCKRRLPKSYRHPQLDRTLRRRRTVSEARLTSEARRAGVPTPLVSDVDVANTTITFQRVGERDLAADLTPPRCAALGRCLARLHRAGLVHGDLTTRNVRISDTDADSSSPAVFLIDFGLGSHSGHVEDHAMDIHVFEESVSATASDPGPLLEAFQSNYRTAGDPAVLQRLDDVRARGRYR